MKARLNQIIWKMAVTLGLVEPPRMQPIPVRAQRDAAARPRRR
ncbi:PA1414 family protein [Stutzerimonas balearica]|nr:PA1414 family protein [Stutzerimonas balearica]